MNYISYSSNFLKTIVGMVWNFFISCLLATFIKFEKKMFLFDSKYDYYESNNKLLMYCDTRGHAH
jgi:hypothetical protein